MDQEHEDLRVFNTSVVNLTQFVFVQINYENWE